MRIDRHERLVISPQASDLASMADSYNEVVALDIVPEKVAQLNAGTSAPRWICLGVTRQINYT